MVHCRIRGAPRRKDDPRRKDVHAPRLHGAAVIRRIQTELRLTCCTRRMESDNRELIPSGDPSVAFARKLILFWAVVSRNIDPSCCLLCLQASPVADAMGPITIPDGTTLQLPSGDGSVPGLPVGDVEVCPPFCPFESSSDSDIALGSVTRTAKRERDQVAIWFLLHFSTHARIRKLRERRRIDPWELAQDAEFRGLRKIDPSDFASTAMFGERHLHTVLRYP